MYKIVQVSDLGDHTPLTILPESWDSAVLEYNRKARDMHTVSVSLLCVDQVIYSHTRH